MRVLVPALLCTLVLSASVDGSESERAPGSMRMLKLQTLTAGPEVRRRHRRGARPDRRRRARGRHGDPAGGLPRLRRLRASAPAAARRPRRPGRRARRDGGRARDRGPRRSTVLGVSPQEPDLAEALELRDELLLA